MGARPRLVGSVLPINNSNSPHRQALVRLKIHSSHRPAGSPLVVHRRRISRREAFLLATRAIPPVPHQPPRQAHRMAFLLVRAARQRRPLSRLVVRVRRRQTPPLPLVLARRRVQPLLPSPLPLASLVSLRHSPLLLFLVNRNSLRNRHSSNSSSQITPATQSLLNCRKTCRILSKLPSIIIFLCLHVCARTH